MTVDLAPEPGIIVEEVAPAVSVVWLNRPAQLNALSSTVMAELTDALGTVGRDSRAVVLSGRGRAFCAGGDLKELYPLLSEADVNVRRLQMRAFQEVVTAIRSVPCPVVAAVNGVCAGAGISLALASDVVVAGADVQFHPTFTRAGLLPDLGSLHLWTQAVGPRRAKEMAFLPEPIGAEDARAAGMVNRVVAPGQAVEAGVELARRLAAGPRAALQMIKDIINREDQAELDASMVLESYAQAAAFSTGEVDEGVAAFLDGRTPRFGTTESEGTP
ncbi:enoyl-CoA hydratase/isomerase family protein [Terrabacter carboxydivorans]|uniref:Enoyl-CoA hydratase-related protein n=1 Tax=Terrabacter carboxydivorans TaxID=619730 RepID=A0ABP5XUG3_9MICO